YQGGGPVFTGLRPSKKGLFQLANDVIRRWLFATVIGTNTCNTTSGFKCGPIGEKLALLLEHSLRKGKCGIHEVFALSLRSGHVFLSAASETKDRRKQSIPRIADFENIVLNILFLECAEGYVNAPEKSTSRALGWREGFEPVRERLGRWNQPER